MDYDMCLYYAEIAEGEEDRVRSRREEVSVDRWRTAGAGKDM